VGPETTLLAAKLEDKGAGIVPMAGQCLLAKFKTGGGATGTIRPSTSPRMPTSGFESGRENVHSVHWRPRRYVVSFSLSKV
jgi:hypothetical protein